MSNANRVCKYYARGACLKGEQCDYSHDRKDTTVLASASSSANGHQSLDSDSVTARTTKAQKKKLSWVPKGIATLCPFDKHAIRGLQHKHQHSQGDGGDAGESGAVIPSEHLFCSFSAANGPLGDKCPSFHGEQCLYCRKHCLHPTDGKQREKHLMNCERKENYMKALKDSQEIEYNVCLERFLLKPKPAECKFGLLPECDHAFCLSCIRNWVTSSAPTSGMDIIDADLVRTCPVSHRLCASSYHLLSFQVTYGILQRKKNRPLLKTTGPTASPG